MLLVVDDSPDIYRLIRARLRNEDLDVRSAGGGVEALEIARKSPPSIVLLDIDMPGMDGYEVLRAFKDDKALQHVPVIMLSGNQNAHDKVTAFDLGAVDYVTKPFDFTELKVRIRSVLHIQQLLQLLSQRAQIDGLTGLWNRAFFDQRWKEEVSRCARHGHPLSVAIIDIDHFKSINDGFGHPAGDAVIQGVSRLIQREVRAADVACRYGGEEFVVIMPDTGPGDAHAVAERIRVATEGIAWPRHPDRKVTMCVGVAGCSGATQTSSESWLEAADRNLYTGKKDGRNRVVVSDVTNPPQIKAAG